MSAKNQGASARKNSTRESEKQKNPQQTRETVESVVVAVILAFLFRAFIAEAFVIPTGSMAPTLYGRNKDVSCSQCGYEYATGASREVPRMAIPAGFDPPRIGKTHCPICRNEMVLDTSKDRNHTSFSGDRILVSKFSYALSEPSRWDVIVFKYPGNAKQNYIKRLIGLPDEAVMIRNGNIHTANLLFRVYRDIYADPLDGVEATREFFAANGVKLSENVRIKPVSGSISKSEIIEDGQRTYALTHNFLTNNVSVYGDRFQVQRKPPHKLRSMLQIVDDTNYVADVLKRLNWPSRWQDWSGDQRWTVNEEGGFSTEGDQPGVSWLRYRHLTPTAEDWAAIREGEDLASAAARRGRLIDDYYAYNSGVLMVNDEPNPVDPPTHWVGDLALECQVDVNGDSGALLLDLVEGGAHYRCRIDVATGAASLSIVNGEPGFASIDSEPFEPATPSVTGATDVRGSGSYRLRFANVDDQLTLWVNGAVISFDGPTTYHSRTDVQPVWSGADAGDAEPIGIGGENLPLEVTRLRVFRDIYYVATTDGSDEYSAPFDRTEISRIMSSPAEWSRTQLFARRKSAVFGMEENDFFPLGDNSPESKDARMWDDERYVNRQLLIGKAVLIYWPHPWQSPIPYFPNFSRMRLIR